MKIYFSDTLNFISNLSIKRVVNVFKLVFSYYLTKIIQQPVHWGQPMSISFEPTTACNLKCPECPSGLRSFTRETGNSKLGFFKSSIDQIADKLLSVLFYFQGEPYINPDFLSMVEYASNKGLYTMSSTNGHFLNDENCQKTIRSGLDRLIISVDGTTQETYQAYRKEGSLEQVLAGAKNLIQWKKKLESRTPHVIFQFLVVKPNEHQISEIFDLAKEIGVDEVKLKTAQLYNYKNGNPLIPSIEKYSRYRKTESGKYIIKNKLLNHCWKMWHASVVTWNGIVVPCCFDKDAAHQMGDLKNNTFNSVWRNKKYSNFRASIIKGRQNIGICNNCTEGCKVWV